MEPATLYFDNNATTFVAPEVLEAMLPFLQSACGNPSSLHAPGERAADALAAARSSVARLLGARSPSEVLFTSGGTEAIHTAIHAGLARHPDRRRLVTSAVEHAAVLAPLEALDAKGEAELVKIGVDGEGVLERAALLEAIDDRCALVSLQLVNNETGVITSTELLDEVGERAREHGTSLHVDAMQAAGKLAMDVATRTADFVSVSAHKFHGPKGVGALWVHEEVPFAPLFRGGPQEGDRRAGTENVPGIVGMGRAADLAREHVETPSALARLEGLRDELVAELERRTGPLVVHGAGAPRVASTASVGFPGISGEAAVALLSEYGVAVSTGSACSSGRQGASHVLEAMGVDESTALGTLRFSLSRSTTEEEVRRAAELTGQAVGQLRDLSPFPDLTPRSTD